MLTRTLFFFLVASAFLHLTHFQSCVTDWFGDKCMFKCYCDREGQCRSDGTCAMCYVNATLGFFGPACQYVDAAQNSNNTVEDPNLVDDNDLTCAFKLNNPYTTIKLGTGVPFLFFRIGVDQRAVSFLRSLIFFLNNNVPCINMRIFTLKTNLLDIYCDNNVLLTSLTIRGQAVPFLCTVRISAGRNTVLKHSASQSTLDVNGRYLPAQAVDGNTVGELIRGNSCSSTLDVPIHSKISVWWMVTFPVAHILQRVVIFGRSVFLYRLAKFNLTTYGPNDVEVDSIRNIMQGLQTTFNVLLGSKSEVYKLKIHQDQGSILTLCEVMAFGDVWCPDDSYGLWCQYKCSCQPNQSCSLVTGHCSSPCPVGRYGHKCQKICPKTCVEPYCRERYGGCVSCRIGYTGKACYQACAAGFYGQGCVNKCLANCGTICNHINGSCTCKPAYQGSKCDECKSGFYGPTCSETCSDRCLYKSCERTTGLCISCAAHFEGGGTCNYCKVGWWGQNCSAMCASNCEQPKCDKQTGACKDCKVGWWGQNCSDMCASNCEQSKCDKQTGACKVLPACPPGKYGPPGCEKYCSRGCSDNCDLKDGSCTCLKMFKGETCHDCVAGYYSSTCSHPCSNACVGKLCNRTTGICFNCTDNFTGVRCENCKPSWWSGNCTKNCPVNCGDLLCDRMTGHCLNCATGFYGESFCIKPCSELCKRDCNMTTGHCLECVGQGEPPYCQAPSDNSDYPWGLMALILLLPILACVFFICWRYRRPKHHPEQGG